MTKNAALKIKDVSTATLEVNDSFYTFPVLDTESAAVSAAEYTEDNKQKLGITDDNGNIYTKGLELQYDSTPGADIAVMITVPDGWAVVTKDGNTEWTQIPGTNSYVTAIPNTEIAKVVSGEKPNYDDEFSFLHTSTGTSFDPAVRVIRPPGDER